MSNKFMITYKRKRVTSHVYTADGTTPESSGASSSALVSSLAPKYGVGADNNMLDEDNFSTSTKQHDVFNSVQQVIKEEAPKQSANASDIEQTEVKLCDSLQLKEQPEIYCSTSTTMAEACENKLECTDGTNNHILVSSCVHSDRTTNQTEDSSSSVGVNSHQYSNNITGPNKCKSRFSPLLTFRRRVKNKTGLEEPAAKCYSRESDKYCSILTCNPPSSPLDLDATPLFKQTGGNSLDVEDKVTIVGTSTGLSVMAEHLLEQISSHIPKSVVHHTVPSHPAEDANQSFTPEHDGTPISEFNRKQEISELDARADDSNKTSAGVIEVPKVVEVNKDGYGNGQTSSLQSPMKKVTVNLSKSSNRSEAADFLQSQGSTRNIPIIVLDDDSDERGKGLKKSEIPDQLVQEKNKTRLSLGQINLNCAELPQERLLSLDEPSVYKLPDQDQYVYERKGMSHPVERLFFTKEKDAMHGKQKHHEGNSTMHNSYSNFFDPTPSSLWNAENFKEPSSRPSELKFRILDKVPEFNLDLSLDSFPDSSVRNSKFFHGGTSSGSHFLTERLGTYSYKRHSALWSEEELDFLWIGVRRYGTNNWNAMLRDKRLRFSNSRNAEDLARQWDKEQKNLLGADLLQSIRASARGPPPPSHISEDYAGTSSWSGSFKPPFLSAPTDLSLGDMYLRSAHTSERSQHHLSRNLSLGGFPVASSPYGRSSGKRRRMSKLHKSYYDTKELWCQDPSERVSQFLPMNQEPINNLPEWLTKDVEMAGINRLDVELWPSMEAPGHSAADRLNDMKPHVLPDGSLKSAPKRKAEWRAFSEKLFQTSDGALDLNQRAAGAIAGPLGATATSDTGASSEETVSDS